MDDKKELSQEEMKSELIDSLKKLKESAEVLNIPQEKPTTEEQEQILREIAESVKELNDYFNNEVLKKVVNLLDKPINIEQPKNDQEMNES